MRKIVVIDVVCSCNYFVRIIMDENKFYCAVGSYFLKLIFADIF